MNAHILLFTQPCCLSCELMKVFLEAKEISFEERDISTDPEARRVMIEEHGSRETPTMVLSSGGTNEVITGFDPELLDQLFDDEPSSSSVSKS
jgi:glutaredoxin